jgi:hypothetical protein
MILDGSGADGIASFSLVGPTPIAYTKTSSGGWIPIWQTGQLAAGDYVLEVEARPEGLNTAASRASFSFDLTFGNPARFPPPPPAGTVINETFAVGQSLEDLGFTVTAPTGTAAIVGNPVDPGNDGALELEDPEDGKVTITKSIAVQQVLKVELVYLFAQAGKLEIRLGGVLLDTVYAAGPSGEFVLYSQEFALADYGLAPGPALPFALTLSNPDAADPAIYVDDLLVSTSAAYTGNAPPSRPAPISPDDGAVVETATQTLTIANSEDPDGDAIHYAFEVFADSGLSALVAWTADLPPDPSGVTAWTVDTPLAGGRRYYWRAIATDQRGMRSASVVRSFSTWDGRRLTALGPAKIWLGLRNSDDVVTRMDVLAEVFIGDNQIGEGRVNNVSGGSSGFNGAALSSIPLSLLGGGVDVPPDSRLKLRVSVRRTCVGGGHASGTLRLWYNGQAIDSGSRRDAGNRFAATIGSVTTDYFLRDGSALNTVAGSSKRFIDVPVDSKTACPARPFKPFGTWSITLP